MLISALCDYYDILAKKDKILPEGYSNVNIHYLIELSPEGILSDIINIQEKETITTSQGKLKEREVPQSNRLPKRTEKPGLEANVIEHRPLYIFGLNYKEGSFTTKDKTSKASKSHKLYVETQLDFIDGLNSPLINAYRKFVEKWKPEDETENAFLRSVGKRYPISGYAFCLTGRPDLLLHEDAVLLEAWDKVVKSKLLQTDDSPILQCCITGDYAPIARVHNKIMSFPNGAATGNLLVNFKSSAFESYGRSQSYNSNISEIAMNKYSEALNTLVKDKYHRTVLNGTTVVHWAMSDDDIYDKIVDASVFNGFDDFNSELMDANETSNALKNVLVKANRAAVIDDEIELSKYVDADVNFYMVGLKANSARLAVEFIYKNRFADVMKNIVQHQIDMQIGNRARIIPIRYIGKELVNPKSSSDEIDPALINKLISSVFNGYLYPAGLLALVIRRIKSDSNNEKNPYIKLNQTRVGIIKAYLNRKARLSNKKEEVSMALNKENMDSAYLCGRLFAVLEKLQIDASKDSINRTIKDAYFSSACSTPKVVFPQLIKLAQHHIHKASYGSYWNYMIGEITGQLGTDFPKSLTLDDQGKFIIGYYQQFWSKNESKREELNEEEKNNGYQKHL